MSSFMQRLQEAKVRACERPDPWTHPLERLRGEIGDDGLERVSTQAVFDYLEVLQRGRGTAACRRLAKLMRELGWTPVRVRDLTCGGYKEQIRGYARDPR